MHDPAETGLRPDDVLQFADVSVLVVGDIMLDSYLSGTVDRVSPEAPVPVLNAGDERVVLGGAANVAANAAAMGAAVTLVGLHGRDQQGEELARLCAAANVTLDEHLERLDFPTIVKQRVVSGTQQLIRIDRERYIPSTDAEVDGVVQRLAALVAGRGVDVLVLADYQKGTLTARMTTALIAAATDAGIPVVVDPKGSDLSRYAGATVIKPNLSEARRYAGLEPNADPEELARAIHAQTRVEHVVISMARDGIGIFSAGGGDRRFPSHVVEVADVSGAGDTLVATTAVALGGRVPVERAVALGNAAAGISCTRFGTAVVTADDLIGFVSEDAAITTDQRIVPDWDRLARILELRRRAGSRVVFANGVFDLLHRGHVALLEDARRQGDVLVVALNSDDSVRRLKGESRPIQPLADRLQVMSAVRFADYVTAFEQDTPLELIRTIRPDIIVKGGDYRPEDVVGGREAQGWGGRVYISRLLDGISTTRLVETGAAGFQG